MRRLKRADRFVVGYPQRKNALYGKRVDQDVDIWGNGYIDPMTRRQADRALRTFQPGACVFELVEVPASRLQKRRS